MDIVTHIDENDCELGEVTRERAHKEGLLHRVAVIYVFDEAGNILVQERRDDGLFDHSSAGHVDSGETPLAAALRELGEELGIFDVSLKEVGTVFSEERNPEKSIHKRHLFKVYSCVAVPGKLQEAEVKSVHFEDPERVFEKIKNDSLHALYTKGFEVSLGLLLDTIKNHRTK